MSISCSHLLLPHVDIMGFSVMGLVGSGKSSVCQNNILIDQSIMISVAVHQHSKSVSSASDGIR
jgi:hypothetical protein